MFKRSHPEPTRAPLTEERYLAIYFGRLVAAARCDGRDFPAMCAFLRANREGWMPATWRQYKAATAFSFQHLAATSDTLKAILDASLGELDAIDTIHTGGISGRTSSMRAKAFGKKAFLAILQECKNSKSQYAPLLHDWLLLGALYGLRPHEWGQADLGDEDGEPRLTVQNSKISNGRAHGPTRTIRLPTQTTPKSLETIKSFIEVMKFFCGTNQYDTVYACCRKLLYRMNLRVMRLRKSDGNGGKVNATIQLYSGRHSFTSTAKMRLDKTSVAALLGHKVTTTAERHYGKKGKAVFIESGVMPSPSDVLRVKIAPPSAFMSRPSESAGPDGGKD